MAPAVDLGAPGDRRGVRLLEASPAAGRHDEVGLGVPDEVLDDALGLGIRRLAEVGPEAVSGGEPDVAGGGDDDVGHHAALETPHPVGEHDRRDAAELREALGQQAQGRRPALGGREPDEPDPAPGEHGAEDVQTALAAPVDDEVLGRDWQPRSIRPAITPPGGLGLGDGSAQVVGRAGVARRPADREQALGADPAVGRPHSLGDERRERVRVAWPGWSLGRRPRAPLDDPADGLVGRPAELGRGSVRAELGVRGEDVQLLPRTLHNGSPSGWSWLALTPPRCRPGGAPGWSDQARGGDFLVAISGDFLMATRTRPRPRGARGRPGARPRPATPRQMDVLATYVAAGGSVPDATALMGIRPSTVKHHLADMRARTGLTTAQLIYAGRAAEWLAIPSLEPLDALTAQRQSGRVQHLVGHLYPLKCAIA